MAQASAPRVELLHRANGRANVREPVALIEPQLALPSCGYQKRWTKRNANANLSANANHGGRKQCLKTRLGYYVHGDARNAGVADAGLHSAGAGAGAGVGVGLGAGIGGDGGHDDNDVRAVRN